MGFGGGGGAYIFNHFYSISALLFVHVTRIFSQNPFIQVNLALVFIYPTHNYIKIKAIIVRNL